MRKYDVELLPAAYSDLNEIFDYILVDNPQAAENMLDKIMAALQHLESFPNSGTPLLERSLRKLNIRMVIVDPYLAFYRFIDNKVFVYRVLYGSRAYSHLLKDTMQEIQD